MVDSRVLLVTFASVVLAPGLGRASVEKGVYTPSTPAPVFLANVDYESGFEPVDDELQAKVSLSADLTVELSLFGWAEYDWDNQTMRFDGYLGDEAAGKIAFVYAGQHGASFQFKDGDAPATNWTYFEEPTIELLDDSSWEIGGVYLPNTPEETFEVDSWSSGSFIGQDFQVQGGSPASGTQSLSFGYTLTGMWTGQRIDIALEPGGPVVATLDDYQDILDFPLVDPGEGSTVSIYATYRAVLTLTESSRRLSPKVNLESPYVHEIWPMFSIDFPVVFEKEIVLPETEVMIPGSAPQGADTGTSETGTTDGTSDTASDSTTDDTNAASSSDDGAPTDGGSEAPTDGGTDPNSTGGMSDTSGQGPTGDGATGGSGDESGCGCTSGRPDLSAAGLILFGLLSLRRRPRRAA